MRRYWWDSSVELGRVAILPNGGRPGASGGIQVGNFKVPEKAQSGGFL